MTYNNFGDLYYDLLISLAEEYDYICSPRNMKIKEKLAQTFALENPRSRLLASEERNANYGFAVGEFLWYWMGANDLDSISFYNKRMKNYSDDGKTLNSAYGYRIFQQRQNGRSQWDVARRLLKKDSSSRQAVILINQQSDQLNALEKSSKDVPCTLALQFFIRENMLHLHVTMRSNDIIWGLTNDLFSFTLLQECMLLELREEEIFKDLKLGTYFHTAGSLHLYEQHFELAKKIINEADVKLLSAPQMDDISSINDLYTLCCDEHFLRNKMIQSIDDNRYSGGLKWMAQQLNKHMEKRNGEAV